MSGVRRRVPLAIALVAAAACTRSEPLRLKAHEAGPNGAARLNQPIVLTFSAPIDPGSVRAETVRVVSARDGGAIAGRLAVTGAIVTFSPRVACRPDLSDGALQPGERYRVEVPGLPQLACVRSLDGAVLDAGAAFEFTTVAAARDAKTEALFVDANSGVRPRFESPAQLVDGCARIRFSKPLDPRRIPEASFWFHGPWELASNSKADPRFKARLVENDGEAVIELALDGPPPIPIDPGEKKYRIEVELIKLCDFSDRTGKSPPYDMGSPFVSLTVAPKDKKEKP